MRKVFMLGLSLVLIVAVASSAEQLPELQVKSANDIPVFFGYVPGEIIVQFAISNKSLSPQLTATGTAALGIASLDAIAEEFQVEGVQQLFAGAEPRTDKGRTIDLSRYYRVRFNPDLNIDDVMEAYRGDPNVLSVEPIGIHRIYATPNDGNYSGQWHLNRANDHDIDAPEAWDVETGSSNIVVAILDSGVRYFHKDLGGSAASYSTPTAADGNMWINQAEKNGTAGVDDDGNGFVDDWVGWDFVTGATQCWSGEDCSTTDNDPRDFNGHGTHCAGNVGAINNNGYGTCAPSGGWGNGSLQPTGNGVKVMACRIGYSGRYLGYEVGYVRMDFIAQAFYYAANNGAKIASCSWGSSNSGGLAAAVDYFLASGGLIFKAAGNDGTQTADYMCARTDIISVAATDSTDNAADFTTFGTWVDISAPGTGILSAYHDHANPQSDYVAALDGTSMATPLSASVAALIWSKNPSWTASQVRDQLYSSADNINAYLSSTYLGKMGAGRINAFNAVNTGGPTPPVAAFVGSPTSGLAPLTVNFTDQSTGNITSRNWTFGDGGTSTATNPSHVYASPGTYTVTLTVSGPDGSDIETKTNYITATACTAPTANFVGSPTSGSAPLTVNFTDQSTGSPTSWSWTFGDGGTSTAQNPSHAYSSPGTYSVTLTATNSCGSNQFTRSNYIVVTEAPAYTVITFDNFETGMGNYTDGGGDMQRYASTTYAHQGTYSADIQDNSGTASSFYTTTVRNVTSYDSMTVTFWFGAISMENGEDFYVEYYNGSAWQTLARYIAGTDFSNGSFYQKTIMISRSSYTFPTGARLRFRCDASANNDDVFIDEIEWRGWGSGGGLAATESVLPEGFSLSQNYPNPFNPSTTVEFSLPYAGVVTLGVYNMLGQRVVTLADGTFDAGVHAVEWDASQHATGVYFYRIEFDGFVQSRKMLLLK